MNKDLIKQLKKNGFPKYQFFKDRNNLREPLAPTLSELIEACPRTFDKNGFIYHLTLLAGETTYCALYNAVGTDHDYLNHFYGSTPEEAVSKLWLELNRQATLPKR